MLFKLERIFNKTFWLQLPKLILYYYGAINRKVKDDVLYLFSVLANRKYWYLLTLIFIKFIWIQSGRIILPSLVNCQFTPIVIFIGSKIHSEYWIITIIIIHSNGDVHRQSKTVSTSKLNAAAVKNEYFLLLNVQTSSFSSKHFDWDHLKVGGMALSWCFSLFQGDLGWMQQSFYFFLSHKNRQESLLQLSERRCTSETALTSKMHFNETALLSISCCDLGSRFLSYAWVEIENYF